MKDLTAKEKAKELVNRFIPHSNGNSNNNEAKQCALIAVEEILKSHYKLFTGVKPSIYKYYEEVKSEIEKL